MADEHEDTAPVETVAPEHVAEAVPVPPVPEPNHPIAKLARYTHDLLGQSLVGSHMVVRADGEWIRREDVLKLL